MDLSVLGPSATFYVLAIVFLTQTLKEGFNMRGWPLQVLPLLLGIVLALGGLQTTSALLFPSFPPLLAAVVSGMLLGASANGGYQTATWLQDRNATVRAQATVTAQQQAGITLPVAPPSHTPPTTDAPQRFADDAINLIATPLPRTMAILPDALTELTEDLDAQFSPAPFS